MIFKIFEVIPHSAFISVLSLTRSQHQSVSCRFCVPSQNWEQLREGDRADVMRRSVCLSVSPLQALAQKLLNGFQPKLVGTCIRTQRSFLCHQFSPRLNVKVTGVKNPPKKRQKLCKCVADRSSKSIAAVLTKLGTHILQSVVMHHIVIEF